MSDDRPYRDASSGGFTVARRTVLGGGLAAAAAGLGTASGSRQVAAAPAEPPQPGTRPNIVLIMLDDLGYGDLSSYYWRPASGG